MEIKILNDDAPKSGKSPVQYLKDVRVQMSAHEQDERIDNDIDWLAVLKDEVQVHTLDEGYYPHGVDRDTVEVCHTLKVELDPIVFEFQVEAWGSTTDKFSSGAPMFEVKPQWMKP